MFNYLCAPDTNYWNSISSLVQNNPGVTFVMTQNSVNNTGLPNTEWAEAIGVTNYSNGTDLGFAIATALYQPNRPAYVMMDELNAGTITLVHDAANFMRTYYGYMQGLWGCLAFCSRDVSISSYKTAIDELLRANAIITCEMYAKYSDWCSSGNGDPWLVAFYRGRQAPGFTSLDRFVWLANEKTNVITGSTSRLTVMFAVSDQYLDGATPNRFMDHLFYVWVNSSQYRSILLSGNGGAGSYKWQGPPDKTGCNGQHPPANYVTDTGRDDEFNQSWVWYCGSGSTGPRVTQPTWPC